MTHEEAHPSVVERGGLMVMMLAMSVAPAFAAMPLYGCQLFASDGSVVDVDTVQANQMHFYKKAGYTCVKIA